MSPSDPPVEHGRVKFWVRLLLLIAVAALAIAPLGMPESYSAIEHTTSESAAQGVDGAWVARLGFVAFGAGVGVLTFELRRQWNIGTIVMHASFALFMVGAAAFSSKPWFDAPYDSTEDFLHSAAATAMGVCFATGVVSSLFDRSGTRRPVRMLDGMAVVASIAIPFAMFNVDGVAGVLQRLMFGLAFWWYLDASGTGRDRVVPDATR